MYKKFPLFSIFIFLLTIFIAPVNAYDDKTTHPALTDEIVDFYNLSFPDKQLTSQQKEWIIEGSILEDTPPRWINHFYDPINKVGWSGEYTGIFDKETVRIVSQSVIAPYGITPVSSLEWLHNEQLQAQYGFYKGAKTWERGILEMIKGNEEESYKILGYILHLIEDASVPEHTRNDTHAHELEGVTDDYGSPYEEYLKQYDRQKIKELNIANNLKKENLYPLQKSSIDGYLISLAEYSNKYFFSKDTINDSKYQFPKIVGEDEHFGYGLDENGKEFILAKIKKKEGESNKFNFEKIFIIEPGDDNIIEQYFSRLSRQAVLNGAGVIDLFHTDAALAKEYPRHPITYDFSVFNYFEIPRISITGELIRIKSAGQSLMGQISSAVSDTFSSVGGLFSNILSPENANNASKQDIINLNNNLNNIDEKISISNLEVSEIPAVANYSFTAQVSGNIVNNAQNEKLIQIAQIQAQLAEIKNKAENLNQQVQSLSQKSISVNNSPIVFAAGGGSGGGGGAPVILSVSGSDNLTANQQSDNQQEITQDSRQNSTSTNQTASSTENISIATSTTDTTTSSQEAATSPIVISEILFDAEGSDKGKEFIELYNLTTSTIDLNNWLLKYHGENSTSVKSLAVFGVKSEDQTLISGHGFLLIGLNDYDAVNYNNVPADILRNENLPNGNEKTIVILYNEQDVEIDRIIYDKNSINNEDRSLERKAWQGGECLSSQKSGEFLGNGCDRDSENDFEIRAISNPQNSLSFPEPRNAPSMPDNFNIQYSSSTTELIFNWQESTDYSGATSGIIYKIFDNSNKSASSTIVVEIALTGAVIPISEIGRDYDFSIQAFDRDGMESGIASSSISVPSFLTSIYFYKDPRNSEIKQIVHGRDGDFYLVDFYYDKYPFAPSIPGGNYQESWKLVVFYLNQDAAQEKYLSIYKPENLGNQLPINYGVCADPEGRL